MNSIPLIVWFPYRIFIEFSCLHFIIKVRIYKIYRGIQYFTYILPGVNWNVYMYIQIGIYMYMYKQAQQH